MKSIYIEQDFLTPTECDACIQFYQALREYTFYYETNNTRPLKLSGKFEIQFQDISQKVLSLLQRLDPTNQHFISNHEIVEWIPKSKMDLHNDFHYDKWSVMVYLNDDYYGGRTIFEDGMTIIPKKGSIILFNGSELKHGVTEMLNGERYTMAYWIRDAE